MRRRPRAQAALLGHDDLFENGLRIAYIRLVHRKNSHEPVTGANIPHRTAHMSDEREARDRRCLLHSTVGLSFWGGVDPQTGVVIDVTHPLHGESLAGKALAIPSARGSCTGSQIIVELLLNGVAPAAILLRKPDKVILLASIVAEEVFGHSLPIICIGSDGFAHAATASHAELAVDQQAVRLLYPHGESKDVVVPVTQLDRASAGSDVALSSADHEMLSGDRGTACRVAMSVLLRMARLQGAAELIPVSQVHIDGCIYTGAASLRFAQRLVEWGGRVAVPTSLNAISIDQQRWRQLGVPPALGEPANALAEAYVALGARPTFTCAPYLLPTAPRLGEHIGWGESNAVVYANSCLGARTQKYPGACTACVHVRLRARPASMPGLFRPPAWPPTPLLLLPALLIMLPLHATHSSSPTSATPLPLDALPSLLTLRPRPFFPPLPLHI